MRWPLMDGNRNFSVSRAFPKRRGAKKAPAEIGRGLCIFKINLLAPEAAYALGGTFVSAFVNNPG